MISNFDININSPSLIKALETYEKEVSFARYELNEVEKNQYITCNNCNKKSQVKKFQYSDKYWYEKPHGCMGGDIWHEGGIYLKCPKCNKIEKISMPFDFADGEEIKKYNFLVDLVRKHGIKREDIYEGENK